jgi:hypothetical protein
METLLSLELFYQYGRLPLVFHYAGNRVIRVESSFGKDSWSAFRKRVFKRDNYICQLCGKDAKKEGLSRWVCDHIIPLCVGGREWWQDPSMSNFQTLCPFCNYEKSIRDEEKITKETYDSGYSFSSDMPNSLNPEKEVILVDYLANKYNVPLNYIRKAEKFYHDKIQQADVVKFWATDQDNYIVKAYVEYALNLGKKVIEIFPENAGNYELVILGTRKIVKPKNGSSYICLPL